MVSLVSVVSFRPFRFVVSGFSTCPIRRLLSRLMDGKLIRKAAFIMYPTGGGGGGGRGF